MESKNTQITPSNKQIDTENTKYELKITLEEYQKIKDKVLKELDDNIFPDLNFLYSDKVLEVALPILYDLLKKEKENFKKLLEIPNKDFSFEDLEEENNTLGTLWMFLDHLQSVNKNDKIDNIIETFEPDYVDFGNEIAYNKKYYDKLKYLLENGNLNEEQQTIVKRKIEKFELRGIDKDEKTQEKLKEISKKLAELTTNFRTNVVKAKAEWEYHITNFEDIKDLPKTTLEKAKKLAEEKGKQGYIFTADPTMVSDILTYCHNQNIRKDFSVASLKMASEGKYDNRKIILDIVKLKEEKAKLLGYKNYAQLSVKKKMAESPEQVIKFIENIAEKARKKAEKELDTLKEYFHLEDIKPYDVAYYSEKYKKEKMNLDTQKIKEYFEFDNVLSYLLGEIAENIYGVQFKELDIETYNKDVKIYEVYQNNKLIAYYFLDAFSQSSKRPGAWAEILKEKNHFKGKVSTPIITNVCNFQKNKKGENLLYLRDVETIFHEFGHAMHAILSESKYSNLNGFYVEWDFVELPSQLNEYFAFEKESLEKFAKHYKTGESIDNEILDKLEQLKTYMKGMYAIRQSEFALLDMYLYNDKAPKTIEELDKKTLDIVNRVGVFKRDENYKMYCSFAHIFASGYDAGYYSYRWADIIVDDIAQIIKENKGIFNYEKWKEYVDKILKKGSSKPAGELFKDFSGKKEPNIEAFLVKNGLI